MSIKYIALTAVILGTFTAAFSFWNRKPAYQNKMEFIPSLFATKGLGDKVLQVKIRFDEVKTNAESAEITAEISMPFDFNGPLSFRWKLGQNVNVLDGNLNGQIDGLKQNEIKMLRLKVNGFSKQENHQIAFEIFGASNGRKIYGDSLIASDLENTFENTVQNVERIKASQ